MLKVFFCPGFSSSAVPQAHRRQVRVRREEELTAASALRDQGTFARAYGDPAPDSVLVVTIPFWAEQKGQRENQTHTVFSS
jgi:hypothetical protein